MLSVSKWAVPLSRQIASCQFGWPSLSSLVVLEHFLLSCVPRGGNPSTNVAAMAYSFAVVSFVTFARRNSRLKCYAEKSTFAPSHRSVMCPSFLYLSVPIIDMSFEQDCLV